MTRDEKNKLQRAVIKIHCMCDYWGGMLLIRELLGHWPSVDYWGLPDAERKRLKDKFNKWTEGCKNGTYPEK